MIYGINFNNTEIPEGVRRKFARRKSIRQRRMAVLQGVAQSAGERDLMLLQANNGHRVIHVETRHTPAGDWYGIYIY